MRLEMQTGNVQTRNLNGNCTGWNCRLEMQIGAGQTGKQENEKMRN